MRKVGGFFGAVVLATTLTGCWVQPGHDAGRTNWNPDETAITSANVDQLVQLWAQDLDTPGSSYRMNAPLSTGGAVFVSGDEMSRGTAAALDAATGALRWQVPIPHAFEQIYGLVGDPVHHDGTVVIPVMWAIDDPGHPGQVLTLDPATGATLDHVVTNGDSYREVLSAQGEPAISALHLGGDAVVDWTYDAVAPASTNVWANRFAIVGDNVVWSAGTNAIGFVPCPPAGTGSCGPAWTTPLGGEMYGWPDGSGPVQLGQQGAVYADQSGRVTALDAATGAIWWTAELGAAIQRSPAVAGGTILVTTGDNSLVALPSECGAATCSPLWETPLGSAARGPVVAGDVVYVAMTTTNEIKAYSLDDGSLLATIAVGAGISADPIVDDGRLLVSCFGSRLVAFGLPED